MRVKLMINGQEVEATILSQNANEIRLQYGNTEYHFYGHARGHGRFVLDREVAEATWQRQEGAIHKESRKTQMQLGGLNFQISEAGKTGAQGAANALSPVAPMPGLVRKIAVKKGERVKAGQVVAVLEAMKLQLDIHAGGDGVVKDILAKPGDMVAEGAQIVAIEAKG